MEEIEQLSRQDAELSSSAVVSSPSALSHTGDPVCLRSLDNLPRASFWNGRHAGTADYGTVMSASTKVKDVLASDNGPLFIIDALQWLLFSPEALPRDSECQGHSLLELHVANARAQNDGWGMLLLLMGAFNPKRARIPAEDVLSPVELEKKSWKLCQAPVLREGSETAQIQGACSATGACRATDRRFTEGTAREGAQAERPQSIEALGRKQKGDAQRRGRRERCPSGLWTGRGRR